MSSTKTAPLKEGVSALPQSLKDRVPEEYLDDAGFDFESDDAKALAAAGTREQIKAGKERAKEQFRRGRSTRNKQPRDYRGRFRDILARLKVNLGESELNEVVSKVEDAEAAEDARDYGKASDAATDVVQMIDRLEEGALNPNQLKNLKDSGRALGKAIAYLPLPQGEQNAKLRFSDLPPTTQTLLQNLEKRVREKLEPAKANELLAILERFASGALTLSSDDLQAQLSKLLSYLID